MSKAAVPAQLLQSRFFPTGPHSLLFFDGTDPNVGFFDLGFQEFDPCMPRSTGSLASGESSLQVRLHATGPIGRNIQIDLVVGHDPGGISSTPDQVVCNRHSRSDGLCELRLTHHQENIVARFHGC